MKKTFLINIFLFSLILRLGANELWATVDNIGCHIPELNSDIRVTTSEIDALFDPTINPSIVPLAAKTHPSVSVPTTREFDKAFSGLIGSSLPTPSNIPKIPDSEFQRVLRQLQNRPHFPPNDKKTLELLINELLAMGLSPEKINDFLHRPMHAPSHSISLDFPVITTTHSKAPLAQTATSGSELHLPGPRNFKRGPDGKSFDLINCCSFDSKDIQPRNLREQLPPHVIANSHPNDWVLPMDAQGIAYPRDHELGIYNVGNKEPHPIPREYQLSRAHSPKKLTSPLPHLQKIELHPVQITAKVEATANHAAIPAKLTPKGENELYQLLEKAIGLKKEDLLETPPPLIGEGGFNYVFKICPKGKACFVAKIKKVLTGATLTDSETQKIIEFFVHDAFMEGRHEKFLEGVHYLDPKTKGVAEFKVNDEVARGFEPGYPNKQLAHVIKSPHPQSAEMGLITQDFVPWKALNHKLPQTARELENAGYFQKIKSDILNNIMGQTQGQHQAIYSELIERFLNKVKNFEKETGPQLSSIDDFLADCKTLGMARAVVRMCGDFRSAFNIPDDFEKRILALEQSYRDSAGEVIKDRRKNFTRVAMANVDTASGAAIEVGFDLNHGENVMWIPSKGQFGIPDR